jgi:hypothetical protein
MNYFKEKGDDMIKITPKDPLQVPIGLIARLKAKKAQICIQWVYSEYLSQDEF